MEEYIQNWLFDPLVGKIITVFVIILILIIVVRLIQKTLSKKVKDTNLRYKSRKIISFFGYMAAIFIIATTFSDKLGGLTVVFGLAGAGIAFALQEVIASVAGWFAISFANFYKTGDRVQLGQTKGDVIDIGLIRTTLMECGEWVNGDLYNGRVVRLTNSVIFKGPVFNYSGEFPFLWDEIKIPIKYGSDFHFARQLFENISNELLGEYSDNAKKAWESLVNKYVIEDAGVNPMVTLIANDNWIEFTIRYVVDYKYRRKTKDILFTRILDEIEKNKNKLGVASATFQIVESGPIDIKMDK
jgi:small-conductance mechanosensitive channel